MNLVDAAGLAKKLMVQFRLVGWKFRFDEKSTVFGSCTHGLKIITLSAPLIELNEEYEVRDTILHEIAHALVGPGHDHDATWKRKAKEVGAKPNATYDSREVETVPTKYISGLALRKWQDTWRDQSDRRAK